MGVAFPKLSHSLPFIKGTKNSLVFISDRRGQVQIFLELFCGKTLSTESTEKALDLDAALARLNV